MRLAEPLVLRGDAAALVQGPAEALSLLDRLHADKSIVWPLLVLSEQIGLPDLDEAGARLVLPPADWAERIPLLIAESIAPVPSPPLPVEFTHPSFARFLQNVLVWNEAHLSLIRARLAGAAGFEKTAVEMTAAALLALSSPDAGRARSVLSAYLQAIGVRSPGAGRGARRPRFRASRGGPDWKALRTRMGWLRQGLEGTARPLAQIHEDDIGPAWRRSLEGRAIAFPRARVRTISLPGDPIEAMGTDGGAVIYILRGGILEAVVGEGETVVLYSADRGMFQPELFAVSAGGDILLLGGDGALIVRPPREIVRRLRSLPWKGTPRSVIWGQAGEFFVAADSAIFRMNTDGHLIDRHEVGGDVAGMAFLMDSLYISRPSANRIERLVGGDLETVTGDEAGFSDQPPPRFRGPQGIAMEAGKILIADSLNHAVRWIRPDGRSGTVAGGGAGRRDGPAAEALFFGPFAVAPLADGGIAVAEKGLRGVRIIATGPEVALAVPTGAEGILTPREIYAHIDTARASVRRGKMDEAIAEFDRAIEGSAIDGNLHASLMEQGAARSAAGRWQEAVVNFRLVAEIAVDDVDAGVGHAEALIHLGETEEASSVIDVLEGIYRSRPRGEALRDPRFVRCLLLRARVRLLAGEMEGAVEAADTALHAKEQGVSLRRLSWLPEDADLYVTRCRALLDLGELERALEDSERAIELDPHRPDAHTFRGDALVGTDSFPEAAEAYKEAIRIEEGTPAAHIGLARLYCRSLDDTDKAIDHLDRYLTLGGDERTAGEILSDLSATARDRRGSYAEAIRVDADGRRYLLRIYEDGTRVKTPAPWPQDK